MKITLLLIAALLTFSLEGQTKRLQKQTDGKTLRVKIGTVSGVDDIHARMRVYPCIEKVTIVAKANSGTLRISFKMRTDCRTLEEAQFAQMLIRLFDRNGAYLTHVVSEPLREVFGEEHLKVNGGVYNVAYNLPTRDLRDASIAEFGFFQ